MLQKQYGRFWKQQRHAMATAPSSPSRPTPQACHSADAYASIKASLLTFTKSLSRMGALKGVRANNISPGMVYVDDGFFGNRKRENPAEYEQMLAFNPGGRMGRPDELAATRETMGQVVAELQPHIEATALGSNEGFGLKTRRTDRLIERSPTARSLVMDPLVQGLLHSALRHAHIVSAA